MSRRSRQLFDAAALGRVQEAVAAAEQQTGGEIRVVVVEQADGYEEVRWEGAAYVALLAAAAAAAVFALRGGWGGPVTLWILLPAPVGGALGYLLTALWPALRRRLAGDALLERRARARAERAFLQDRVFATRDRTGVLLLVALFEHRVVVLGDQEIDRRVGQAAWREIVEGVATGIRRGAAVEALIGAVDACGELLRGVIPRRSDDRNELPDEIRLEER